MDQKIRTAGGYFVTYVCICGGVCMMLLGFAMLSDPSKQAKIISTIALISSTLLLYGGITNFITTRKGARHAKNELKRIDAIIQKQNAPSLTVSDAVADSPLTKPNILAYWEYTAEEWKAFMLWEKKKRKSGTWLEAAAIVVIGTLMIMFSRQAEWGTAIRLSLGIAVFYWLGKYFLFTRSLGEPNKKAEVVITHHAVIINGKYNSFKDDIYWLQKVNIAEQFPLSIFIIEYGWKTRNGNTFEEIRIPIPPGKLDEAKEVKSRILHFN